VPYQDGDSDINYHFDSVIPDEQHETSGSQSDEDLSTDVLSCGTV